MVQQGWEGIARSPSLAPVGRVAGSTSHLVGMCLPQTFRDRRTCGQDQQRRSCPNACSPALWILTRIESATEVIRSMPRHDQSAPAPATGSTTAKRQYAVVLQSSFPVPLYSWRPLTVARPCMVGL